MEATVVVLRWTQYVSAFVLMGGGLFALLALPATGTASARALGWPRRLLAACAIVLAGTSLRGLLAQTAVVAGEPAAALDRAMLASVVTEMAMGPSSLARVVAGLAALAVLGLARSARSPWACAAFLGAAATASLAWMGHGAASEGALGLVHLAADLVHIWAAATWIGALAFFLGLTLAPPKDTQGLRALHSALAGFSGGGSVLVALLIATGLVNGAFLVGPGGLGALFVTTYGQLLLAKLALFGLMLALAATNRFRLTPALERRLAYRQDARAAVAALRRSLLAETAAALAVIALVAWLGRLAPIAAP